MYNSCLVVGLFGLQWVGDFFFCIFIFWIISLVFGAVVVFVFLVCMWNAMIEIIIKINHENKCSQRYFELGAYWCRDD